MRIVSDKEFLSFFVQFLETKSALAFIKFWIDSDSFKTSAELCTTAAIASQGHKERWRSPNAQRPQSANSERGDVSPRRRVLSKSVSLNIGAFERGEAEETISLGGYSELLDSELLRAEADPLTEPVPRHGMPDRLLGDGSSQANSMSDICVTCDYGAIDTVTAISSEADEDDDEDAMERKEKGMDFELYWIGVSCFGLFAH